MAEEPAVIHADYAWATSGRNHIVCAVHHVDLVEPAVDSRIITSSPAPCGEPSRNGKAKLSICLGRFETEEIREQIEARVRP
jgi:hypothetical protein